MSQRNCPFCSTPLTDTYLYVRGAFAALHFSAKPDVSWLSRSDLTQIDLGAVSEAGSGAQAVLSALRCDSCGSISFRAQP